MGYKIKTQLIFIRTRVGYKEWVNAVERLCDSCQWGPFTFYWEWPLLARFTQPFYSVNSLLITHSSSDWTFENGNLLTFVIVEEMHSGKFRNTNFSDTLYSTILIEKTNYIRKCDIRFPILHCTGNIYRDYQNNVIAVNR